MDKKDIDSLKKFDVISPMIAKAMQKAKDSDSDEGAHEFIMTLLRLIAGLFGISVSMSTNLKTTNLDDMWDEQFKAMKDALADPRSDLSAFGLSAENPSREMFEAVAKELIPVLDGLEGLSNELAKREQAKRGDANTACVVVNLQSLADLIAFTNASVMKTEHLARMDEVNRDLLDSCMTVMRNLIPTARQKSMLERRGDEFRMAFKAAVLRVRNERLKK